MVRGKPPTRKVTKETTVRQERSLLGSHLLTTLVVSMVCILSPDIIWSKSTSLRSKWSLVQASLAPRMRLPAAAGAHIPERLSVAPGNAPFLPAGVGGASWGGDLGPKARMGKRAGLCFPVRREQLSEDSQAFGGGRETKGRAPASTERSCLRPRGAESNVLRQPLVCLRAMGRLRLQLNVHTEASLQQVFRH